MKSCSSISAILLLASAVCAGAPFASAQGSKCRPRLTTAQRCDNPPVVPKVDLSAYIGKWYQIFTSGSATTFSGPNCVTANYTDTQEDPFRIAVLNCQILPDSGTPNCVTANATKRPGGTLDSQLQVKFFPQVPAQTYSIAALLGNPNHKYAAAAVYGCDKFPPAFQPSDGFYIISRSPYTPKFILKKMIRKLRCNGYKNVKFNQFIMTNNSKECEYFDGPKGFTVRPVVPNFNFPPSR